MISALDWMVMVLTLGGIALAGAILTRKSRASADYLKGSGLNYWAVGLSVMATQASAITFLSAPGLGYESGLRFVQFYFGLPLAVVVISAWFIPLYYKLNVFTAYAFLEQRFGLPTRLFTAFLFLVQRGLAAGLTIFAPAIVLATLFGWSLPLTNVVIGLVVIAYTVSGGSKAVSMTQKWQMALILGGMLLALFLVAQSVFTAFGWEGTLAVAKASGRLNPIDFTFDLNERYTLWSGLLGGFFLSLSYFGTDQSQVQRYLGGKNLKESRLGLLFNGVVKIPMQFFILLIGVFLYLFFLVEKPPVFFNSTAATELRQSEGALMFDGLEGRYDSLHAYRLAQLTSDAWSQADFENWAAEEKNMRLEARELVDTYVPARSGKDTNYVFLYYVLEYLPKGIIGLILAVILAAAMSSTSGEISALATTTVVDFWERLGGAGCQTERGKIKVTRLFTAFWGVLAIAFALTAHLFDNLIEMVNLLGSLFYGTILGVFLVAFFLKWVRQSAVLAAAAIAQVAIFILHLGNVYQWSWMQGFTTEYLWYNLIACGLVMGLSVLFGFFQPSVLPTK